MKSKSLIALIAVSVSFAAFAQDVEIPDYITATIDDFSGAEKYTCNMLEGIYSEWPSKNGGNPIIALLSPMIVRDEITGEYKVALMMVSSLQNQVRESRKLLKFQIKAGSDLPVQTIKIDSYEVAKGSAWTAMYTIHNYAIVLAFNDEIALSVMEKIAYQTKEKITTLRLSTDTGNLTIDAPLPVSRSLREFLKWAEEFYKAKGLTWPSVKD